MSYYYCLVFSSRPLRAPQYENNSRYSLHTVLTVHYPYTIYSLYTVQPLYSPHTIPAIHYTQYEINSLGKENVRGHFKEEEVTSTTIGCYNLNEILEMR
jgi:hypothetical protein